MNEHARYNLTDKSIAVLPFVNMSADPENEYFSDGITEEIINALTKIDGLKVIARTSSFAFKNKNIDVREIAQQLSVATILEGSVRKASNRLRITAQLINAGDGVHIWSENFDRELEDIFALQDEISLLIADQIRENFGHLELKEHLVEAPTQNIEAYNLYLKGRYHQLKWNAENLLQGVEYYKQSIQLDPSFALPYFGAGLSCGINASWGFVPYDEGIEQAREFLNKGLEIEGHSYLGYFALATIKLWGEWDFRLGYEHLNKSIQLNPSFTDAEEGMAELCTAIGEFDKALIHTRNILTLNPLSPNHYYTEGNIYYLSKKYELAIESMMRALKVDPEFSLAIEVIAACYIHLKDYKRLNDFLEDYTLSENPIYCRALYQLIHPDEKTEIELEAIRSKVAQKNTSSLVAWHLYLQVHLGNHDIALDILEAGVEKKTGQFINFKNDPFLIPLRQHKRFKEIINSVFHDSKLPLMVQEAEPVKTQNKSFLSEVETSHYLSMISVLLENEELFLNPNLSLKYLAGKMDLHPNKLSWLLNEQLGQNFNEYINSFRLEAFKQKATDAANSHLTILALAYDSGFNSKSVFNSFFKKVEGMTPRAWVKAKK